jgi:hypothetical protein
MSFKMSTIKSVKIDTEKRRRLTSGDEYIPVEIKNPGTAMRACLHLFMSHSVDFFEIMLTVISEKYGHSKEEMTAAVMADPRMKNMSVNPVIHSLGYFEDSDLQKSFAKMNMGAPEVEEQPKPKIIRKIKIKKPSQ